MIDILPIFVSVFSSPPLFVLLDILWLCSEFVDSSKGWTLVLSDNSDIGFSVNSPLDLFEVSSIGLLVDSWIFIVSWTCALDWYLLIYIA